MVEDKLEKLLKEADAASEFSSDRASEMAGGIIKLAARRRTRRIMYRSVAGAAAVIVVVLLIMSWRENDKRGRVASLEEQVAQLSARTDSIVALLEEVIESDKRQQKLAQANARLAKIENPLEEINAEVDKAAFILLYQADVMYEQLKQTESAVKTYNQVIEYFGQTRWADVARERIAEIQKDNVNEEVNEGDIS